MRTNDENAQSKKSADVLEGKSKFLMLAYNVILAFAFSSLLMYYVAYTPYLEPRPAESNASQSIESTPAPAPDILLATMLIMILAGGAGGVLSNLRGLFKYTYEKGGLPAKLELPYYLRPWIGAMTGLSTLLLGHLMTSALSDAAVFSWATSTGRLPYTGVALLAGFASQEFIGRMKAVAETLFSQNTLDQLSAEDQLRKIKKLSDEGLISAAEADQKRRQIIEKL